MAGHSHAANVALRKGRVDKKRGALFGKLSRAIIAAVRRGGGDPKANLALRYAIDKSRKNSMPRETIERAIKKGLGELGADNFDEVTYEGYGPGGVAVICDALTENRNRTAGEIRKAFEVHGGNLGAQGCVGWMFERKGLFTVPKSAISEEELFELALEAGGDDVRDGGERFEILCPVDQYQQVADALDSRGLPTDIAELTRISNTTVELDLDTARAVLKLLEVLEENEDVQAVTANYSVSDDVMAQLMADD